MADEKKTPSAPVKDEVKKDEVTAKQDEAVKEEVKEEVVSKDSKEEKVEAKEEISKFPELKVGMTVKIFQRIKELNLKGEEKERVQFFEGMIIAKKHGKEVGGTITVRKVSDGVGVEKIYPLNLPTLEKIEVKKIAEVRRAKLYFLKKGYKKRLKEKVVSK